MPHLLDPASILQQQQETAGGLSTDIGKLPTQQAQYAEVTKASGEQLITAIQSGNQARIDAQETSLNVAELVAITQAQQLEFQQFAKQELDQANTRIEAAEAQEKKNREELALQKQQYTEQAQSGGFFSALVGAYKGAIVDKKLEQSIEVSRGFQLVREQNVQDYARKLDGYKQNVIAPQYAEIELAGVRAQQDLQIAERLGTAEAIAKGADVNQGTVQRLYNAAFQQADLNFRQLAEVRAERRAARAEAAARRAEEKENAALFSNEAVRYLVVSRGQPMTRENALNAFQYLEQLQRSDPDKVGRIWAAGMDYTGRVQSGRTNNSGTELQYQLKYGDPLVADILLSAAGYGEAGAAVAKVREDAINKRYAQLVTAAEAALGRGTPGKKLSAAERKNLATRAQQEIASTSPIDMLKGFAADASAASFRLTPEEFTPKKVRNFLTATQRSGKFSAQELQLLTSSEVEQALGVTSLTPSVPTSVLTERAAKLDAHLRAKLKDPRKAAELGSKLVRLYTEYTGTTADPVLANVKLLGVDFTPRVAVQPTAPSGLLTSLTQSAAEKAYYDGTYDLSTPDGWFNYVTRRAAAEKGRTAAGRQQEREKAGLGRVPSFKSTFGFGAE